MTSTPGPILRVRGLRKRYTRREGWHTHTRDVIAAIDLDVRAGTTLAIVGDSGAGKSTLARCLARLEAPDAGEIWFDGVEWAALRDAELRARRPQVQLVFQDAATALNPRFTAEEVIAEPLVIQQWGTPALRRERVNGLLREVGLAPEVAQRRCTEFSGGQQQRLAIARALALDPRLVILDEALSGLDLSTEAQLVALLRQLQQARGLTYILISHDLGLVAQFADEIVVMSAGRIVERGQTRVILLAPEDPATCALVESARSLELALPRGAGT